MRKILVTGGTGFVGTRLVQKLADQGHQVRVLSRNPDKAKSKWRGQVQTFKWDAPHGEIPKDALEQIDSVINLMGENIGDKRWSAQQKIKLRESRVDGTRNLIQAIKKQGLKLKSFISTSAVGIYPINQDHVLTESSEAHDSFLASLCIDWEKEVEALEKDQVDQVAILRVGVVLGRGGGAAAKLMPIFKLGAGGPVGAGTQMMSWIHVDDLAKLYQFTLEHPELQGPINAVAPNPVSNKEFSKALAKSLKRPCLFPVPPIALKLAMGEMSTIVLDGQEVKSEVIPNTSFEFDYPSMSQACDQLSGNSGK